LSADFSVALSDRLADAVERGIVLHFVAEFELDRPRWYWADERLAEKRIDVALSYHAITRQYRLSTGALHQSFPTLAEALDVLGHLRRWPVADAAPQPEAGDEARLRLYLDVSQLPKPFQVMAFGHSDWHLDSGSKAVPYSAMLSAPPIPLLGQSGERDDGGPGAPMDEDEGEPFALPKAPAMPPSLMEPKAPGQTPPPPAPVPARGLAPEPALIHRPPAPAPVPAPSAGLRAPGSPGKEPGLLPGLHGMDAPGAKP
jgi:hypothetical protein